MKNKATFAVIDLGTNTFHLIIASCQQDSFSVLHEEKDHVGLGREGIGMIAPPAFDRAKKTIHRYAQLISHYPKCIVKAFGTAALRLAKNQADFIHEIHRHTGIQIEVIDGSKEAALIHRGVLSELKQPNDHFVIMDIGGGSVEFIHSQSGQSQWFRSFDVGIALLENDFHQSDPITDKDLQTLELFLDEKLQPMKSYWQTLGANLPKILIGASGSFEIIFKMVHELKLSADTDQITSQTFETIYHQIISSSQLERRSMHFLPKERRSIIIMAIVLIQYILRNFQFRTIRYTASALKEGAMMEFCYNKGI